MTLSRVPCPVFSVMILAGAQAHKLDIQNDNREVQDQLSPSPNQPAPSPNQPPKVQICRASFKMLCNSPVSLRHCVVLICKLFFRCESLSEQLSSALKIRFECGCARLDPDYDPKDFVHYIQEEKRKYLALESTDKWNLSKHVIKTLITIFELVCLKKSTWFSTFCDLHVGMKFTYNFSIELYTYCIVV